MVLLLVSNSGRLIFMVTSFYLIGIKMFSWDRPIIEQDQLPLVCLHYWITNFLSYSK